MIYVYFKILIKLPPKLFDGHRAASSRQRADYNNIIILVPITRLIAYHHDIHREATAIQIIKLIPIRLYQHCRTDITNNPKTK